ncbi:MAG: CdaR family protein [Thermodesulfovibrionales bacterium]
MRRGVFRNIGLKILSVVLALSLWFFVTYHGRSEMALVVPVTFKNMPRGLELLRESVKSVTLNVQGQERILKNLQPAELGVSVDLSGAKKGEEVYYFDKSTLVVPRAVDVVRIEPTSVRITLDESLTKTVPVKASLTGLPERGYRVVAVRIHPSTVAVEGARTELARVAFLRTEPVDITGLDGDVTQNVRLNPNGKNIRVKAYDVALHISIRKAGAKGQ